MIVYTLLVAIYLTYGYLVSSQTTPGSDFSYTIDKDFSFRKEIFGNIVGVDIDKDNNIIIFHRGSHKWDALTFDSDNVYLPSRRPIEQETVVTIDPIENKVIGAWGRDIFFMPHGLSLDLTGKYLWLTDVALHQVFKYPIDGSKELIALGTPFVPGSGENNFCKPTSVADTGDVIFVADGYCNSRVVMFSSYGKYLGEFGQSPYPSFLPNAPNTQPSFNIPHKLTYSKETRMLCVADRENGRIPCFSFEPKLNRLSHLDGSFTINNAIEPKFTIADPAFNGRLFSLDYSPIQGGLIVAVSGESLLRNKPPMGFVYNATNGLLLSRFAPPGGQTFGMAHDVAISLDDAKSVYVADVSPVNLWRFSRPNSNILTKSHGIIQKATGATQDISSQSLAMTRNYQHSTSFLWYGLPIFGLMAVVLIIVKAKMGRGLRDSFNSAPLYSNNYPNSIKSLFGDGRYNYRSGMNSTRGLFNTMFSRRAFHNLLERTQNQHNDFSRIPLDDSDNMDDDKSDSDVEEFNINQANPSTKINV